MLLEEYPLLLSYVPEMAIMAMNDAPASLSESEARSKLLFYFLFLSIDHAHAYRCGNNACDRGNDHSSVRDQE